MGKSLITKLRIQAFFSWVFYAFIGAPLTVLFLNLFDYKLYGRDNLKKLRPPFILVSNHLTLLDSWFAQGYITIPAFYLRPWRQIWNLAEGTNYFRGLLAPLIWVSKSIPIVRKGAIRDQKVSVDKVIEVLKDKHSVHIFPEGTRSRSGRIDKYTTGIGRIYLKVKDCSILPVYIRGVENALPIGVKFPRLFKKVDVVIGKPIKLKTELKGSSGRADIAKQIYDLLVNMEKDYFESGKYRAKEILAQGENN